MAEYEGYLDRIRAQIESNDPVLTELSVGSGEFNFEDYHPRDGDWARVGEGIARHTYLTHLTLDADCTEEDMKDFLRGVYSNRSVQAVQLFSCDLYDGRLFPMLVPFFKSNTSLERLDIDLVYLEQGCLALLLTALGAFDSLKHFGMTDSTTDEFTQYDKGKGKFVKPEFTMADVFRALKGHSRLESLTLAGTLTDGRPLGIGMNCWRALAAFLQDPGSKISALDLSTNEIDDMQAAILAPALICVKEVDLSYSYAITERGWRAVSSALRDPRCSLQKLSIRHMSGKRVTAYFAALETCGLEELDLHDTGLGDAEITLLARSLSNNCSIRSLTLSMNFDITIQGWREFATSLQGQNSAPLERLNLSSTHLTGKAFSVLQNALGNKRSLRTLNLGGNPRMFDAYGTDQGRLAALSQVLQNPNCLLESLDISSNNLDDACIGTLTNVLAENNILKSLNIARNDRVSPAAWRGFEAVLQNPESQLESIDLNWNHIDDDAFIALSKALTSNSKLKELIVDGAHSHRPSRALISPNGWGALSQTLCDSSSISSTYHSNHTLQKVAYCEWLENENGVPTNIRTLLRLNRDSSQSQAARLKIFDNHFRGGIVAEPFVEMALSALPHAISWMGKDDRTSVSELLFLFLRSMPMVFVGCESKKRKRV